MTPIDRLFEWFRSRLRRFSAVGRANSTFDREGQRQLLRAALIGVVVWTPVYALKLLTRWLFALNLSWLGRLPTAVWVLLPLLLAGLLVAAITRYRGQIVYYRDERGRVHQLLDVEGDGLERAIALFHASDPTFERILLGKAGVDARWDMPTLTLAVRKFAATVATMGAGGSGGLEASVALIGESLSAALFKPRELVNLDGARGRWIQKPLEWWSARDADDLQTAQLGGIAAAIATLTGAPFTSAFFAAEVMYRRRPLIEKLIYSLISALVAYFLTVLASGGHVGLFDAEAVYVPPSDWSYYVALVLMGLAISIFSIYFVRIRRVADRAFHHDVPNVWLRHLSGMALTGAIALVVVFIGGRYMGLGRIESLELVLGTGEGPINWALAGQMTAGLAALALLAKVAATWMTIGSGGSAGLLTPSLYIGTMTAVLVSAIAPFEPMTLIIPAMTGSLVSIVNVPLAAIMLPVELFSSHYLVPALVVLVVCTLLTQDDKIYLSQRDTLDRRQIIPGTEVRRMSVPLVWQGRDLVDLDIRRRFGLTVIGVVEISEEDGREAIRLDRRPDAPLTADETLIVMGAEADLDAMERAIFDMPAGGPVTTGPAPAADGESAESD